MAEIASVFDQVKNTYCAMRKMEYLLEAVRLTYENVKDINNPKKSMNDLGADGMHISYCSECVIAIIFLRFSATICVGVGTEQICYSRD